MVKRTQQAQKILIHLGERFREIRTSLNLSQEEVALQAGFSRSYYTEIETGKRNVSLLNLGILAETLNVSLSELLNFSLEDSNLLLEDFHVQKDDPEDLIISDLRQPSSANLLNSDKLAIAGLTTGIISEAIAYTHGILDTIDDRLMASETSRISQMVELANLSSIIGNLLGAGIANVSGGMFVRNGPHKYPDLLAQTSSASDIEIKVALETNKAKGHLAKEGYYLTCRYVLGDKNGKFQLGKDNRGDVVWIWEIRFGWLSDEHFNISNTAGDSGKTAVVNADGYRQLSVIYCDLERCPYSKTGRTYKQYVKLVSD